MALAALWCHVERGARIPEKKLRYFKRLTREENLGLFSQRNTTSKNLGFYARWRRGDIVSY
jgi:hypothetical protein